MKKVGFVSLGCSKNLVDSEVMMGKLRLAGYEITPDAASADTLVINTCGFIDAARRESVDAILEAARLKTEGNCQRLVVAGCMVERYQNELRTELPEVDAFIGTNQIDLITSVVDRRTNARALPVVNMGNKSATYLYDDTAPRLLATPGYTAFLKIAEGCDRPCAFCAIPLMRGSYRSRRFASVVREAHQLAEQGVKELILIAQDSTRYGEDLGMKDGLATLLRELCRVDGIEWVRVMYAYPTHVSDAFLDAIASEPKAVKYLDIPLQHASQKVLKAMRRGGTRAGLERLIERARTRIPNLTIRTTFITGFPGETNEDYEQLVAFVKNARFDRVGVFTYSDEDDTHGKTLTDKVDETIAMRRRKLLMREQEKISRQINRERVGKTYRVLFEGEAEETDLLWQGRTEGQAPEIDGGVLINDAPEGFVPQPGAFVNVEITEAHTHDLVGHIKSFG